MQTGSEEHFARVELASQGLNGLNPMAVRIDLYAEAQAAGSAEWSPEDTHAATRKDRMKTTAPITTLFLDIGGVLLNNGWDRHARKRAAKTFQLDSSDMEARHRLVFEVYEQGRLSLDDYLRAVIFHEARSFSRAQFRRFMFAQSEADPRMIELVTELKATHRINIAVVSNEAREVNAYRIHHFKLRPLVDFFVSSCFVHLRKPDPDIFRLALDMAQVEARRVVYVDDTSMFVDVAARLGIHGVLHTDYRTTAARLAALGLARGNGHREPE